VFDDPMREPHSPQPPPGVAHQSPPPVPGQEYPPVAQAHHGFPTPALIGPSSSPAKGGPILGVMSLLLALIGLVCPFLPFNMDGYRQIIAFPLGAIGIVLGVLGVAGRWRAKPLAAVGIGFSCLTLGVGALFLLNYYVL